MNHLTLFAVDKVINNLPDAHQDFNQHKVNMKYDQETINEVTLSPRCLVL